MNTPVLTAINVHHLRAITASWALRVRISAHDDDVRPSAVTGHIRVLPVVISVRTDERKPQWTRT
jgi:hypothetical protein